MWPRRPGAHDKEVDSGLSDSKATALSLSGWAREAWIKGGPFGQRKQPTSWKPLVYIGKGWRIRFQGHCWKALQCGLKAFELAEESSWRTNTWTYQENNVATWHSGRMGLTGKQGRVAGQPWRLKLGLSNHFCFSLVAVQWLVWLFVSPFSLEGSITTESQSPGRMSSQSR